MRYRNISFGLIGEAKLLADNEFSANRRARVGYAVGVRSRLVSQLRAPGLLVFRVRFK